MSPRAKHLARHYAEMVIAMFAGMALLGIPAEWAMRPLGTSWQQLTDEAPAAMLLLMATTMTVPMVGWMMYRDHGARANLETSAAMYGPTLAVIAVLAAGALTDLGPLMLVEHVAMLAAMLAVMLARPDEYAGHGHGAHRAPAPAAAHAERVRA